MKMSYDDIIAGLAKIRSPGCSLIRHKGIYPTEKEYDLFEFRKDVPRADHSVTAVYGMHGSELAWNAALQSAEMAASSSHPVRMSIILANPMAMTIGSREYEGTYGFNPEELVSFDLNRNWHDPLGVFQSTLYRIVRGSMAAESVVVDHHSEGVRRMLSPGRQGYILHMDGSGEPCRLGLLSRLSDVGYSVREEQFRQNRAFAMVPRQHETLTRYLSHHHHFALVAEDMLGRNLEKIIGFHSRVDMELMGSIGHYC
jgi:hypothetical protein